MRVKTFNYVYELDSFYTTGSVILDSIITFYLFVRKKINKPYSYRSPKFNRLSDLNKWQRTKEDSRIMFGKLRPCSMERFLEVKIENIPNKNYYSK